MEDETLTFLENYTKIEKPTKAWVDKAIATFLLSQLEGHARTINMPFMGRGSDMLKEL